MLSAFQARKARTQPEKSIPAEELDLLELSPVPLATPSPIPKPSSKLPSKRKPRDDKEGSLQKKKKARVPQKTPRYFDAADDFVAQEDVIIIDPDQDVRMSEVEDDQMPISIVTPNRSWSPSQPFLDSSEDENEDLGVQPEAPVVQRFVPDQPSVLSTFVPEEDMNFFILSTGEISEDSSGAATAFFVPMSQSIALVGVYSLTLIKGSVSVSGVTLEPSKTAHEIFAPRSSPIPILEVVGCDATSPGLLDTLPSRIKAPITDNVAILLLRELRTGVEGLGRVVRTFEHVFKPSPWLSARSIPDLGLAGVYLCSHQDRDIQPFTLPKSWGLSLSSVLPSPSEEQNEADHLRPVICFIKGPKNVGKSTFARTMINRLSSRYRQVAFLDCDLGQSEFTPSGSVSLTVFSHPIFGPSFTHPTIPHASHFIGSTTPRNSPSHYLTAVQALIQTYRLEVQYASHDQIDNVDSRISDITPLVVNTMGWTKGLGSDLNYKIEELVEPTDVFELGVPTAESFPWTVSPPPGGTCTNSEKRLHTLSAVAPSALASRYTPADHRALSTISYFHAKSLHTGTIDSVPRWETSLPLCAHPPYEVEAKVALDNVCLAMSGMEDIASSEIQTVLNGAIIALVEAEEEVRPSEAGFDIPYTQGFPPPSPHTSNCVGLGLVRSLSSTHLHIITPLPPHLLARCRVLTKGEVELPIWGMLDFRSENGDNVAGVERSKVPYLRWGKGEGLGGEKRRVRRNLMRRGQL